jgi:hypothetical protein
VNARALNCLRVANASAVIKAKHTIIQLNERLMSAIDRPQDVAFTAVFMDLFLCMICACFREVQN